jgi:tetratricopeptide (TPR) repeat protein
MRFFVFYIILFSQFSFAQGNRSMLYAQATEFGYRHQYKASEEVLTQIIDLYPMDSMAYFDRAIMRENLGDTLGAISDLTKEINIDGENADNYFLRGMLLYKTQQFSLALLDFKKVIELDFGNADAHFFAAQLILALRKNPNPAKRQLKQCLKVNPAHREAQELLRGMD